MELFKSVLSVIVVLVMFIGILYLAYITTKFIGKRYSIKGKKYNNLTVIETAAVGPDRQLMIVKVAGKCLLLGATPQNISLICELDENRVSEEFADEVNGQPVSFSEALKKVTKEKFSGKGNNKNGEDM